MADKKGDSGLMHTQTTQSAPTTAEILVQECPGTSLLVDKNHSVDGVEHAKEIILLPQPSEDPDDPLNWSALRKYAHLSLVCLWAFMLGAMTNTPGVTYGALIPALRVSVAYLNTGQALSILTLGIGNLLLNPLALRFGRRPVYIISAVLCTAMQAVNASAQNGAAITIGRTLLGLFGASFEQLPAVTVSDVFFVHQRGYGLGLYFLSILTGSFLGPLWSGFIVENVGWRWVYWTTTIIMGGVAVLLFFGLEESAYDRPLAAYHGSDFAAYETGTRATSRRTYMEKLRLITPVPQRGSFVALVLRPVRLMTHPIIIWCGICYGFSVSWLAVMAVTANTIFQTPIYNFSFAALGLTNVAPLLGGLLILWITGPGVDRFLVWMARRNNGVMEAESRVYPVYLGGPIMGAGLILYGVSAAHGVHWIAPVIGMALIGAALPIAGEVALGYASEAYPQIAGEATTAVIVIRNIIGCGMTFSIEPWIVGSGLQNAFIEVGVLACVVFLSGSLLIWQGKRCRMHLAKRGYGRG